MICFADSDARPSPSSRPPNLVIAPVRDEFNASHAALKHRYSNADAHRDLLMPLATHAHDDGRTCRTSALSQARAGRSSRASANDTAEAPSHHGRRCREALATVEGANTRLVIAPRTPPAAARN